MFCRHCGKERTRDGAFCVNCGAPFSVSSPQETTVPPATPQMPPASPAYAFEQTPQAPSPQPAAPVMQQEPQHAQPDMHAGTPPIPGEKKGLGGVLIIMGSLLGLGLVAVLLLGFAVGPKWFNGGAEAVDAEAMFKANPERTGEHPGPGVPSLTGELWRFKTGDAVYSSPAVSGGIVYCGSYDDCIYALR